MKEKYPLPGEKWKNPVGSPFIVLYSYFNTEYQQVDIRTKQQDGYTGQWYLSRRFLSRFGLCEYLP